MFPVKSIDVGLLEFAAMPQLVRFTFVVPLNFTADEAEGSSDKSQATPNIFTLATARVLIVTLGRKRLARKLFCCCARMTSTALLSPTLGPITGGLLAHIWPVVGFVQAGEEFGQVNDAKEKPLPPASRAARPQIPELVAET